MTELVFHRLAEAELRRAHRWYFSRDRAIADRFLESIDDAISRILADPESHPVERENSRLVRVRRFPYVLIFERDPSGPLVIIAVPHLKRRPGYWSRRSI
jgi:toxin ParE1/3/4